MSGAAPATVAVLEPATLTHLERLEAESIQIMREVVAEAENPVMLYSIGKDSGVMLHLAMKAFYPAKPPFPLLHVDTTWKFQEMYRFRDQIVADLGLDLIVHVNEEGRAAGINPITHGSAVHTDVMKTEGLKQALDKYRFDVAFGGARRDEEASRAKERVFSFRSATHRWDPKNQRPELWRLYNARKRRGESIRVFPLSNWTELDVWQYVYVENIPIVPLYLAKERPVVERDGTLIMVDDDRLPLAEGSATVLLQPLQHGHGRVAAPQGRRLPPLRGGLWPRPRDGPRPAGVTPGARSAAGRPAGARGDGQRSDHRPLPC